MKVGSLFAGIGGIDLAFGQEGFDIEWANEIDEDSCKTYEANFNKGLINDDIRLIHGDIKNLHDLPKVDIITAGFPCQPFSLAGDKRGFEDARGKLFFEILRIARESGAHTLLLENVKNLSFHDGGKTFGIIITALERAGYYVKAKILNTCKYSIIPQNRERVYIVCFKNKSHHDKFEFPLEYPVQVGIEAYLEKDVDKKYYYNESKLYPILKSQITKKNTCYQWRRKYVRENKSGVCPTLTANMGTGGHNVPLILDDDIRKLTPRECARFQGFPENYVLPNDLPNSKLYKQIGNSVTVHVVRRIARQIKEAKTIHMNPRLRVAEEKLDK